MSDAHPIDENTLVRLKEMVGESVLDEIINLFLEHGPRRVALVRSGQETGDLETVALELHSLKSSAGMLGAERLRRLSERMEHSAREEDCSAIDGLVEQLEQEYTDAEVALKRYRGA